MLPFPGPIDSLGERVELFDLFGRELSLLQKFQSLGFQLLIIEAVEGGREFLEGFRHSFEVLVREGPAAAHALPRILFLYSRAAA